MKVAEVKDIQPSTMRVVEVDGEKVCLANVEGKYYAIGNVCTHVDVPLPQRKLEGYEVQCPCMDLDLIFVDFILELAE